MIHPHRHVAVIGIGALLATAGCSGSDADDRAGARTDEVTASTTSTVSTGAPPSTTTALPDVAELPLAAFDATDDAELEWFALAPLGGLRFAAAPDHAVNAIHDTVIVQTGPPHPLINGPRSGASVFLLTQSVAGSRVATVDEYLRAVDGVDDAEVRPTGDAIELFGRRLRGYEISTSREMEEPKLFSAARWGAPVDNEFAPFPHALMYLADTPAGVLGAGVAGADAADSRRAWDALGALVATAELTGTGIDEPLPPGEVIEPSPGLVPPPEPAAVVDDAAPPLEAAFAPVGAGTYQLPNTGRALTVEVDDGWYVQPNFPGFVVITRAGSIGPGDRELVFAADVVEYVPTAAGPRATGDATAVDGADDLIGAPPPGYAVTDVVRTELDGATMTRFDIASTADEPCAADEPCEVAFITSYGLVKILAAGADHRIWWIEHGSGPDSVLFASALDDEEHLDRATAVVDTVALL